MNFRTILALLACALLAAACTKNVQKVEMSDAAITARVKAELKSHAELNLRFIDVNTSMGEVTVSGLTDSWEDRGKLRDIIRKVPGVEHLTLNVTVQD